MVIPDIKEDFFSQAINGIEAAATLHNYTMLFSQSYDDLEIEKRVVGVMKKHRVVGLIISLSKETNTYHHLEAFRKYGIPILCFDRVPTNDNFHKVFCNIYEATIEMVNWFFNKGYQRIALINGPKSLAATTDRLNGYKQAFIKRKLKVDMPLVESTDFSKESTIEAMNKLLNLRSPPQVILSFNDYVHMDAVQYAKQLKIKVNKDILFASYANLPITSYTTHPPVLSLEQYPYKQGEKAMEIMMKILAEKTDDLAAEMPYYKEELATKIVVH